MAHEIGQVTVGIGITVTEETVKQLLLFLNIWKEQNPGKRIFFDGLQYKIDDEV